MDVFILTRRNTEKAFRHGDIESILANLAKVAGSSHHGGGLLGFASSILSEAAGGQKFNKMDIKRVYFVRVYTSVRYNCDANLV